MLVKMINKESSKEVLVSAFNFKTHEKMKAKGFTFESEVKQEKKETKVNVKEDIKEEKTTTPKKKRTYTRKKKGVEDEK